MLVCGLKGTRQWNKTDYFIHYGFQLIVMFFFYYSDNSIILYVPYSNVFFLSIFNATLNTNVTFFTFISNVNMNRQLPTSNLEPF
jgi:hypothetical protein